MAAHDLRRLAIASSKAMLPTALGALEALLPGVQPAPTGFPPLCDVAVLVEVAGDAPGVIGIALPGSTALRIAGELAGVQVDELDGFARSALAELGNMVAGACVAMLIEHGFATWIELPTVAVGPRVTAAWPDLASRGVVVRSPFGPLSLLASFPSIRTHP